MQRSDKTAGRERIDKLLVDIGLAPSRERARALVMAGSVLVDDEPVTKAGATIDPAARIRLRSPDHGFASRGGVKIDGAIEDLSIDVKDKVILDVGASTGGFTDACLKRGASRVYAVDVGKNLLAYKLRVDPRVVCIEETNARNLKADMLPTLADLAVIDVSFISLTKVLSPVAECLVQSGEILALVKPQFEVGRERVGKGGVVREDAVRFAAADEVARFAGSIGFALKGRAESRLAGPKGNLEIFVYLSRTAAADI